MLVLRGLSVSMAHSSREIPSHHDPRTDNAYFDCSIGQIPLAPLRHRRRAARDLHGFRLRYYRPRRASRLARADRLPRLREFTGYFAAVLLALYIMIKVPYSGMSLNPARTFASAIWANVW